MMLSVYVCIQSLLESNRHLFMFSNRGLTVILLKPSSNAASGCVVFAKIHDCRDRELGTRAEIWSSSLPLKLFPATGHAASLLDHVQSPPIADAASFHERLLVPDHLLHHFPNANLEDQLALLHHAFSLVQKAHVLIQE
jgi:hypothetical protein